MPRARAGPAAGTNFDPLHGTLVDQQASERTLAVSNQANGQRNLLSFVEGVAQAALKARNEFLVRLPTARMHSRACSEHSWACVAQTEVNSAAAQQREVHEAARRRLESDLSQLADAAAGLIDKLFFALKARACRGRV